MEKYYENNNYKVYLSTDLKKFLQRLHKLAEETTSLSGLLPVCKPMSFTRS